MKLVIIESPNKIKKLKSILSSDYEIVASVGHIFDLPKKDLGVDTTTFELDLVADPAKKDILSEIKKLASTAEQIYLASDLDREGHSIAKNIHDYLGKKEQKKCHRLLINAITKEAVENALKNPSTLDLNLCDAQKGRRATDRLVGYKISPIMWNKGLKGTSAGRVQSVALKYVADLEKEIRDFKPEEYWKILLKTADFSAELSTVDGKSYQPKNKSEADAIKNDILSSKDTTKVSEYVKKTRSRAPEPPFITSTMQQAASNILGWNAKQTMQIAQNLFSHGLISYLRTDSVRIEPEKILSIREKIDTAYGSSYLSPSVRTFSNKDASQDAHEAIRPTYEKPLSALSSDESKLLDLIDRRFKASQMSDATFDQASLKIEVKSSKHSYIFKINGSIMTFDGFLKIYGDNKEDVHLPKMSVGSKIDIDDILTSQHYTQPPGRYSDASLIKKLEKDGVGRPSTYASIIDTIINRGYVSRDKKALNATDVGIMVSDFLSAAFPSLVSPEMTSKMESSLDDVASGKSKYIDIMTDFYKELSTSIDAAKKIVAADIFKTEHNCPKCNSSLIKKKNDDSIFLGCSSWPKCGYTMSQDSSGKFIATETETGESCPQCGNLMSIRKGKYGSFMGCQGYPSCTYKVSLDKSGNKLEKKEVQKSDIKCEKCSSDMIIRTGANGEFLACSSYPKCKHTMPIPISECPKCKTGFVVQKLNKKSNDKFYSCTTWPKCDFVAKSYTKKPSANKDDE